MVEPEFWPEPPADLASLLALLPAADVYNVVPTHDIEGMRNFIGADSLAFISIDGLYRAMGLIGRDNKRPQFCDACFTGDYPTRLTDHEDHQPADQLALLAERYA